MKYAAIAIIFYALKFIHYKIYQNLWKLLMKVAIVHCSGVQLGPCNI